MSMAVFKTWLKYPLVNYVLVDGTGKSNPADALIFCLKTRSLIVIESDEASGLTQLMHLYGVPLVTSFPKTSHCQHIVEGPEQEMISEFTED